MDNNKKGRASRQGPTVRVIFDRLHTATDTRNGYVEIEAYQKGARKRFRTGVCVTARQWKNGRVVGRPDATRLNAEIEKKYQEVCGRLESGEDVSLMGANTQGDPTEWMLSELARRNDIRESTREQHRVALRAFRASGIFKRWQNVTPVNLRKWDQMIRKKVSLQSSVHNYHQRVRPYIRLAVQHHYLPSDPYNEFKSPKGAASNRTYLTEEEVDAVRRLDVTGWGKGASDTKDMFLLACCTGLAFSDMVRLSRDWLRVENGRRYIEDRRQKTGTRFKLRLLPEAESILERHGWDMDVISNQAANRWLKAIGGALGIPKRITMHVGRHTFATWALSHRVSIEVVSKMLAHSDIKTTQIYAKVMQKDVDAGFEKLL